MNLSSSPLIDLLEQLASGIYIFEPFYRRERELQEFQTTVERLLEMKELVLVHYLWLQKREIAGYEYLDRRRRACKPSHRSHFCSGSSCCGATGSTGIGLLNEGFDMDVLRKLL